MSDLDKRTNVDALRGNGFHHVLPSTVESRTPDLSVPVAPAKGQSYCQCSRSCCEVEDGLCECGHRDDDHYADRGCWAALGYE